MEYLIYMIFVGYLKLNIYKKKRDHQTLQKYKHIYQHIHSTLLNKYIHYNIKVTLDNSLIPLNNQYLTHIFLVYIYIKKIKLIIE